MLRLIFLIVLGGIVFIGGLLAYMPLSVAADRSGIARQGVFYDRVQGTIWSGELQGVNVLGQPIGEVRLTLQPASLLAGSVSYDFDVRGPAGIGTGVLTAGVGGRLTLQNVVADLNVQELRRLDPRLRQVPSRVSITVPALRASSSLECVAADGRLQTNLLQKLGTAMQWEGPAMAGVLACDGEGGYRLALSNVGGDDAIQVEAILSPRLSSYSADARVDTRNRRVADTLQLLGFQRIGDEYVYSRANGQTRSNGGLDEIFRKESRLGPIVVNAGGVRHSGGNPRYGRDCDRSFNPAGTADYRSGRVRSRHSGSETSGGRRVRTVPFCPEPIAALCLLQQ